MKIIYFVETGKQKVVIRYNCDHMAETSNVSAVDTDGNEITIDVKTTLACAPREIDCRPSDSSGHVYDLRYTVYAYFNNIELSLVLISMK